MDKLKKFTENLLNSEIKDFHQLSGGASAEKYKLILTNKKKYILRRTPDSSESKLAISKKLEAKIQRIVKSSFTSVSKLLLYKNVNKFIIIVNFN